jgi:hypothetical protein
LSNHYDTLGVWRDASIDEIEQRYRFLCARLTDELELDADAAMQLRVLDEAHATLTDPDRRAVYDGGLKNPTTVSSLSVEIEATEPAVTTPLDALPAKARKHLEPQIHDGEEVIAVINGMSSQAIVALQTRLFIVKPGLMAGSTFGARVTSFDYRNITAIEVNKKLVTAVIEVIAAGYQGSMPTHFWSSKEGADPYKLSNCLPLGRAEADKAEPVLAQIRQLVAQLQNPAHQTTSPGVADELAKLAELRQQGILSADEFDAAKRRVLAP